MSKKILLLSAYDAESHKRWRESLVRQFPDKSWTQLVLAPRHFSWRIRGNSMIWALTEKETLNKHFDLIIATSMVDLSSLIGMAPSLANVPSILYFHENQYAYPSTANQHKSIEPLMVSLYSALSATYLKFNSEYNLESFLGGVDSLLKRFPDQVPQGILDDLRSKSSVLPVPIEDECFIAEAKLDEDSFRSNLARKIRALAAAESLGQERVSLELIWNHRWEYDKGPDRLLALVKALDSNLPVRFHIVGQAFRKSPKVFDEIHNLLQEKNALGTWGFIHSVDEYRALLARSDVVLSTAIHDFQGLSVIEACALGCLPLVPNRLAYPEFFSPRCLYTSEYDGKQAQSEADFANETRACLEHIQSLCAILSKIQEPLDPALISKGLPSMPNLHTLSWSALRSAYQTVLE